MFVEQAQFRFKSLQIGKIYLMEIYFSFKFRIEFIKIRCLGHIKATSQQVLRNYKICLSLHHDLPISLPRI
jgi:hypothetical protein